MSDIRFNRWLHGTGSGGVSQDSSGNIGIGTSVPRSSLDVEGFVRVLNGVNITGVSTVGVVTGATSIQATNFYGSGANLTGVAATSNISTNAIVNSGVTTTATLRVTGVSTLGNTVIGGGTTELVVTGSILSSGTVFGSGSVIQVGFNTSPGGSTASTSLVNSQTSLSTFTPKKSNSTIHQIWTFQGLTSLIASTNTIAYYAIAEGNSNTRLVSNEYTMYSVETQDGDGMGATQSIQVSVASTGTSTRSFSVFLKSSNGYTVYATNIAVTFIEVAS